MTPELELLRECQNRALEREGIPMVLSLVDEVHEQPPPVQDWARADGQQIAAKLDNFRTALLPHSRNDDMGCVITVLQVGSYADFGREGGQL
jgi:hypothetical protein